LLVVGDSWALKGKVFVSVDMEGLPHIVLPSQLGPGGSLFNEAREIITRLTRAVAEVLLDHGYRVVVADAHGEMINIDPLKLPRGVELVRGFPRPLSMLTGAKGAKFAIFLGYHARAGTHSTLAHTYAGDITLVTLNGHPASEYLLNAMLLGEWGIPLAMVAGSAKLGEEVEKWTPWTTWLPLKQETGYLSATSPPLEEVEEQLKQATRQAIQKAEKGEIKPLQPPKPVELCVQLSNPLYTELPEQIPGVQRINDTTICTTAESFEQAYKTFEAITFLAWATKQMLKQTK